MHSLTRLLGCVLLASAVGTGSTATASVPEYRYLNQIPLGGDTAWDYLSVDPESRRLYVAHGTHIAVIDLDAGRVVGDIPDTPGVHGFAIAHSLGRGFSSNGAESKVSIVDLKSLVTLAKVDTQEGPDAIVYEPAQEEVYAFNGRARSATVISAHSGQVRTSFPLPGKPEFAVADPGAGRVFVNIEDRNEVVAIDTHTHRIAGTWSIAPGVSPSGMALDITHHRLFVGCANRLMLMMDSVSGSVVSSVSIGDRVDANAFDAELQLAFSSNGEGTVTIAHEDSPQKLTVVQTLKTQPSARTMALDPRTHRIYLAAAAYLPVPASAASPADRRTPVVPGSFKILVYGPADY